MLLTLTLTGFIPSPIGGPTCAQRAERAGATTMKTWSARKTLADSVGGATDNGASAVGLIGTIPVEFSQGNTTLNTMAIQGQPLSEVAAQAGQYIKYKCGKGECGTCEVRVDGKWIRTCSVQVPFVEKGEVYKVHVRHRMVKPGQSSRFYSFRSLVAGLKNNMMGMLGFVREGRKSQRQFEERINAEKELMERVAAKKAAKGAAAEKSR